MDWTAKRNNMVCSQLIKRGISDEKVLEAFRRVLRHRFVPEDQTEYAYSDAPLRIGNGQTISQPYMVALMTELAQIEPGDRVLEIGTGSGYQAAIISVLGAEVYSVERNNDLAAAASYRLKKMGFNDIKIRVSDGSRGWDEHSPYSSIIVTAASPSVPELLFDQLEEGGRIVIPEGRRLLQELKVYLKESGNIGVSSHGMCRFVPLIGEYGWKS